MKSIEKNDKKKWKKSDKKSYEIFQIYLFSYFYILCNHFNLSNLYTTLVREVNLLNI